MKIAQIVSGLGINGAIRHCYELTCELANRGHEVVLVHRPDAWIAQQPFPNSVQTIPSPLHRRWSELKRVADELRQRNVELLHTHMSSAHFFGVLVARIFGLKTIATCHMPLFQPHWFWNDRVISPCRSTMDFQRRYNFVSRKRIDVVPNFINADKFQPSIARDAMREGLGIDTSSFVVGVIGSVDARKGLHHLVRALSLMGTSSRPIHVISVGPIDGKYKQKIDVELERSQMSNRVSFLGLRHDIANILGAVDCVCLPSEREVMPISLMEAMGMGIPVVSTRTGGIPDLVRDGVDGFLVPIKIHPLLRSLCRTSQRMSPCCGLWDPTPDSP